VIPCSINEHNFGNIYPELLLFLFIILCSCFCLSFCISQYQVIFNDSVGVCYFSVIFERFRKLFSTISVNITYLFTHIRLFLSQFLYISIPSCISYKRVVRYKGVIEVHKHAIALNWCDSGQIDSTEKLCFYQLVLSIDCQYLIQFTFILFISTIFS